MNNMQKFIPITVFNEEVEVSYFDNEAENLPVLLFVHGNSSSKETFESQIEYFSQSFRVIAPDLPGHGSTGRLKRNKYSLNTLREFLVNFRTALDIDVFCLLGHSLGGHIALQSLNEISPLKVIVWGTPPMTNPPVMEKMFQGNPAANFFFSEKASNEELNNLFNECFEEKSKRKLSSFVESFIATDPKFRVGLISELGLLEFKDELDELNRFRGEVLFILGENEKIISNEYILHNCFDYFQLFSKGSSHFIHVDVPEVFNFKVLKHLKPQMLESNDMRLNL